MAEWRKARERKTGTPREPILSAVTPMDTAHLWTRLQTELRRRVPDSTYAIWLEPLQWGDLEGERIVLLAPGEVCTWVQQRFATADSHDGGAQLCELVDAPEHLVGGYGW